MLKRLNHIAIAVPDLDQAAKFYRDILGATISEPQALPDHGVTTIFVDMGNTKLELLHPLGDTSPVTKFLEKNPQGGIHHYCLEVEDVSRTYAELAQHGIRILGAPKIGAHGKPVIFLHPKDCFGCLVELEDE
ncbi:methylmalonyl-CoA epimerase [Candidatus Odyssella acanthamoebae]|uniref:methylmalonyl-CoA epimerase n=1 Tax=Candidatus Odyssella acanthamoebae TaxID=91604 RepID=A0A077AWR7_9PROT|nr:methylmalonyl-CoA epimerase [Candidatus Paracaedibacter acanthamoebae]AIK96429.1 methylmalonyl-CoA epimerase [Candidatus Paracaedibacter acanthamoebae]